MHSENQPTRGTIGWFLLGATVLILIIAVTGDKLSSQHDSTATADIRSVSTNAKPTNIEQRPLVAAPLFSIPYQDSSIVTVVTKVSASDNEIKSIIWTLRDAVHSRSLDRLHISQSIVDNRDPLIDFQIYRGSKCASENYVKGRTPCGLSEHQAGDYMYGSFASKGSESGFLYHGPDNSDGEALWAFGAVYQAPSNEDLELQGSSKSSDFGTQEQKDIAASLGAQVWAGGRKASFSVGRAKGELDVLADWLIDPDARNLTQLNIQNHAHDLCASGFRAVKLFSFPDTPGWSSALQCRL